MGGDFSIPGALAGAASGLTGNPAFIQGFQNRIAQDRQEAFERDVMRRQEQHQQRQQNLALITAGVNQGIAPTAEAARAAGLPPAQFEILTSIAQQVATERGEERRGQQLARQQAQQQLVTGKAEEERRREEFATQAPGRAAVATQARGLQQILEGAAAEDITRGIQLTGPSRRIQPTPEQLATFGLPQAAQERRLAQESQAQQEERGRILMAEQEAAREQRVTQLRQMEAQLMPTLLQILPVGEARTVARAISIGRPIPPELEARARAQGIDLDAQLSVAREWGSIGDDARELIASDLEGEELSGAVAQHNARVQDLTRLSPTPDQARSNARQNLLVPMQDGTVVTWQQAMGRRDEIAEGFDVSGIANATGLTDDIEEDLGTGTVAPTTSPAALTPSDAERIRRGTTFLSQNRVPRTDEEFQTLQSFERALDSLEAASRVSLEPGGVPERLLGVLSSLAPGGLRRGRAGEAIPVTEAGRRLTAARRLSARLRARGEMLRRGRE